MKFKPMRTIGRSLSLFTLLLAAFFTTGCFRILSSDGGGQDVSDTTREVDAADVALLPDYRIEPVARDLTFPTAVTFDEEGVPYVIEAGYAYGEIFLTPRLIRLGPDGERTVVATGVRNGPWTNVTYHEGNFYIAEGGQMEGGRILRVTPQGEITSLVEDLPSLGDHHTNGVTVGPDGYLYFSVGTATNSAVVGTDNYQFGWLKRFPDFHDVPCRDIVLNGRNFRTPNPLTPDPDDEAVTGAYVRFNVATSPGEVIPGRVPCSGSVMRVPLGGGRPELIAWGFRNPYGLAFAPDGQLYVADNGYDVRGSRPVWGTGDYFWRVERGAWYGWPDYSGGLPLTLDAFKVPGEKDPQPLLAEEPNEPPHPVARLGVHSSSDGMDFSRSERFGYAGHAFIAQFGDMAPGVGKVLAPVGYRVVRVDPATGAVEEFVANKGKKNGPASRLGTGGLERPVSVRFSPDGEEMYIVDFGIMLTGDAPRPVVNTGVVWKVTRSDGAEVTRRQ